MGWFSRKKQINHPPNPHRRIVPRVRNFQAGEASRLVSGWTTTSTTINAKLRESLTSMRARSREQVINNPVGRRFSRLMKRNVVGPLGIQIQAKSQMNGTLDNRANDAIESGLKDWGQRYADYGGMLSFVEMQRLAIATCVSDGEVILQRHPMSGPYGIQYSFIDPELLDVTRNQQETNGNITRLGVEYNQRKTPVRYWFREVDPQGNYYSGSTYTLEANQIYHCYIPEWVDQARGIPWTHSSLFRLKMLDGYDISAITAARGGAAKMGFITGESSGKYVGDEEDDEGNVISDFEAGIIEELPEGKDFKSFDPNYPHEQYGPFTKKAMRDVGVGFDMSYPSLSGDLEGANYSSIRWGGLDEREMYIEIQNWFIRSFVAPIYEEWLRFAIPREAIKIGTAPLTRPIGEYLPAHYQGKRWSWVDPDKEMKANQSAIDNKLKSRSAIIRDMGEDPDTVWQEIAKENEILKTLGVTNDAETSSE